jgi:hypothetical protein
MRLWPRIVVALVVFTCFGVGIWVAAHHRRLRQQWAAYQVGSAISFDHARRELSRLERGDDQESQIRELVSKWGTGNCQYDLYLARYVDHPDSSETLREMFSCELAWREQLLPRWAHFWCWQSESPIEKQVSAFLEYLNVLLQAEPPRKLTWREVLDLQAVFQLSGHSDLAKRLRPDNWQERFRRWQQVCEGAALPDARPKIPFPDWEGTVPQ